MVLVDEAMQEPMETNIAISKIYQLNSNIRHIQFERSTFICQNYVLAIRMVVTTVAKQDTTLPNGAMIEKRKQL